MAPAYEDDGGSPRVGFRGSITRHLVWLSTPRSGSYPPPRKTRFRLLVRKLYRTGFAPAGFLRKVSDHEHLPPFPSFLAQLRFL